MCVSQSRNAGGEGAQCITIEIASLQNCYCGKNYYYLFKAIKAAARHTLEIIVNAERSSCI